MGETKTNISCGNITSTDIMSMSMEVSKKLESIANVGNSYSISEYITGRI